MVQKGSYLIPSDRCGVWFSRVFHLYGGFKRKVSTISNFTKISVRSTKPNNWLKKKTKLRSIILKTRKETNKLDGSFIKFKFNNNVLLKKRLTPKGKELYGPGLFKLRRKRFLSSFVKIV